MFCYNARSGIMPGFSALNTGLRILVNAKRRPAPGLRIFNLVDGVKGSAGYPNLS